MYIYLYMQKKAYILFFIHVCIIASGRAHTHTHLYNIHTTGKQSIYRHHDQYGGQTHRHPPGEGQLDLRNFVLPSILLGSFFGGRDAAGGWRVTKGRLDCRGWSFTRWVCINSERLFCPMVVYIRGYRSLTHAYVSKIRPLPRFPRISEAYAKSWNQSLGIISTALLNTRSHDNTYY